MATLSSSSGEIYSQGLSGIVKVVHIDPVVRGCPFGCCRLEPLKRISRSAAARVAQDKDVVPLALHFESEGNGGNGPFLSYKFLQGLKILGCREAERPDIGFFSELFK
jgi:hypothetical protein